MKKAESLPPIMSFESDSAGTDIDKANLFNQFFFSVFTRAEDVELREPLDGELSSITISEEEVFRGLVSMDCSKAAGLDGIPPSILKFCVPALVEPLHHLFTTCLSSSKIPEQWKTHCIVKTGDKSCIQNYRPISLLCVTSKVLEQLIYDKIIDFILLNSITYNLVSCVDTATTGFCLRTLCFFWQEEWCWLCLFGYQEGIR